MNNMMDNSIIREDYDNIYDTIDCSSFNGKSILITGATGMIGSYLCGFFIFLKRDKAIDVKLDFAVRSKERAFKIFGNCDMYNLIEYDACTNNSLTKKYDYIIYASSLANAKFYGSYPVETILPNVVGINEILSKYCGSETKILFFSSGSVYGNVDDDVIISEDVVGLLNYDEAGNEYPESKRCGECICLAYWREYGTLVDIVRIHHTYGPTLDYKNDSRVFSEFVKNLVENKDIEIKGNGIDKRSFCYISDLLVQILTVILNIKGGNIYNLGNPDELITIGELAETISRLVYPPLKVTYVKRSDKNYCPSKIKRNNMYSIDRVKKMCGGPTTSVYDGFQRTFFAIKENESKKMG